MYGRKWRTLASCAVVTFNNRHTQKHFTDMTRKSMQHSLNVIETSVGKLKTNDNRNLSAN